MVVFVKEHGFEGGAHVPLDVVGQDAQEDVASDTVFVAVVDGTHFEIHGLDAAKGVFHQAEIFVALDELGGGEVSVGDFGAHHIEVVNGGFAGDVFAAAGVGESCVRDLKIKVFRHFVLSDHAPDPHADAGRAAHGSLGAKDSGADLFQIGLGSGEQLFALVGAGECQKRIAADHQAFSRGVGTLDFGEVLFVKERRLYEPGGGELRFGMRSINMAT